MLVNTQTTHLQEPPEKSSSGVNINDFGQYLNYTSFQEIVHHIKKISLERIIANESVPDYHLQSNMQALAKTA